jgi:predicted nucleotidyltransferase
MSQQTKANNELITERLKGLFAFNELMFAYYCGSRAYGTTDKESDVDVVAVFSDLNGITHAAFDEMDIFAYGIDSFIQRQSISDELPLYNLIHADDFVKAKENLIYLKPEYKDNFNKLLAIGFEKVLPDYLDAFIEYYDALINKQQAKVKRAYHIYRVKAIIDNFKKTSKYDVNIPKAAVDKISNYKKNWESLEDDVILEFSNIIAEIKEFRESLKVGDKSEN